jgi:translation initiation factor eIF-2B subunit beta
LASYLEYPFICPSFFFSFLGTKLALSLSESGIDTVLIPDSSIFALMSRVSKVFLGTHVVLADGSLVALSGSLPLCRAAKAHLVPVVVCTGMFKFSPVFVGDDEWAMSDLGSPADVLHSEEDIGDDAKAEVLNPYWDRIPPELVSLFITNM